MKKITLIASLLLMLSCNETAEKKEYIETEYDIQVSEYLSDKDWSPERLEGGLYIHIEDEGSSEKPTVDDYVTLFYQGYLLDGTKFDGTEEEPVVFPLSRLIKGWQEGIPHFGKGGKGKLIIPPGIAYGSQDKPGIPANSVLVFDIEILDFAASPPQPKRKDYNPEIKAFLEEKGWDAEPTGSGLFVLIEDEGSAEKVKLNHFLTLNYNGYFMNGDSFDGTNGTPTTFPFPVSNLIPGWQEGMSYFGKGGKGKLIVPPYLGYGDRDNGPIPGNSILVFDIEIIDFTEQQPAK